jgi:Adenylate and Guanylate cyclase catalytic domain
VQLMGPLIRKHKGFIIQQYGDGIMALFPDSGQALRCSVEMQRAVEDFQASHMQPGDPGVRIGIGLHRGPLIMGIIGDEVANSPSTISDTVNAAARMEGLTKHFGARVLFTDACAEELSPESAPAHRFLGRVRLKGKQSPTDIYECFGGDPEEDHRMKQELLPLFMQGMEAYMASRFPEAAAHLEKVLQAHPGDLPARFLLDRIRLYIREGVPEGWQGVDILTFK